MLANAVRQPSEPSAGNTLSKVASTMPPAPTFSVRALVRPNILSLTPYRCARDDFSEGLLLDANENALGPAIPAGTLAIDGFHRYPDPRHVQIRAAYAQQRGEGVPAERVFTGAGSDEVIDLLLRVFCRPGLDKVLVCPPTYGMYGVAAHVNDVGVLKVPLFLPNTAGVAEKDVFQVNLDAVMAVLQAPENKDKVKMVFLCSPGNPTGVALRLSDVRRLLEFPHWHGLVVVDEAYIDFTAATTADGGRGSVASWTREFPNLVVLQTLSKAFGLAGVRLGMCVADDDVVHYLDATKAPYNISAPAQAIALRALKDEAAFKLMLRNAATLNHMRDSVLARLAVMPELEPCVAAKDANFFLIRIMHPLNATRPCNERAKQVYLWLAQTAGVVIRFRGNEMGLEGTLRISSPGTEAECALVVDAVRRAMQMTASIEYAM